MAEETAASPPTSSVPPIIRYVPFGMMTVYHVTEQELDFIEYGTPDSVYFSFAIFLLSSGSSFLTTLLTASIQSPRLFDVFLGITLVGIVGGLLLLIVWARARRATTSVIKTIRRRKPPAELPP